MEHIKIKLKDGELLEFFDICKKMINIKNNTEYILLTDKVINATNAQDGQHMCLYTRDGKLYVREIEEFGVKFEEAK